MLGMTKQSQIPNGMAMTSRRMTLPSGFGWKRQPQFLHLQGCNAPDTATRKLETPCDSLQAGQVFTSV